MITSFSTAVSAMKAQQDAIDVVGNNLANLNTSGYKAVSLHFSDMMSASLNGGTTQIGSGVSTPATFRNFVQGATQSGAGLLTAAIQGPGFFALKDASGNDLYTRDGNFKIDSSGSLVTFDGAKVMGWQAVNGVLNASGAVSPVVVPAGNLLPPKATTNVNAVFNLNAAAAAGSTYAVPVSVVDSLGATHTLTITLTKATTANQWTYTAALESGAATSVTAAGGTLNFNTDGTLNMGGPPPTTTSDTITITGLADKANDMTVKWNFVDSTKSSTITQAATANSTSGTTQDGFPASTLTEVSIADGGLVVGKYSDGRTQNLAQLALASIRNPDTLVAVGNNAYRLNSTTAAPGVGTASTGGRGDIVGGSLEASTVDIATEFTNLMVYQRGYQASSKVITTADQVIQDTINLIR